MYQFDTQAARKADTMGGMINEMGKYIGVFTQAEEVKAKTGTEGIAFVFQTQAGQKARLSLYTLKADGTKLMGFDAVMAIMACLGLRNIDAKPGTVTRWNSETKAEEKVSARIFPELQGKPIGVLLETEDYPKDDGSTGTRMVLKNVFQASTGLTASEILDRKTTPEQIDKMVANLRHRPIRAPKGATPSAARQPAAAGTTGSGFEDMDDDIPFRDPLAFRGAHQVL